MHTTNLLHTHVPCTLYNVVSIELPKTGCLYLKPSSVSTKSLTEHTI